MFKCNKPLRLPLRAGKFLDREHRWSVIDPSVRVAIEAAWEELQQAWDRMFPDNPLSSEDDEQAEH